MDFDFNQLPFRNPNLIAEIKKLCFGMEISKGTEFLHEHQYVKVLPVVIKRLVKVYSRFEDKELVLYYNEPSQSCIMSFYAVINNSPGKVFATSENDTTLLLIPTSSLPSWIRT